MPGCLSIAAPDGSRRTVALRDTLTVGRDPSNDIVLPNDSVSRVHAVFVRQPGGLCLVDLHSTNGTWVNGVVVTPDEAVPIDEADIIRIGPMVLRYQADG